MIAKIVLFLALVLTPCAGWAAITLDGSTSVLDNDTSSTVSLTCPAGDVLVVNAGADNQRVTSATYNGVTLTELYDDTIDGAGIAGVAALMAVSGCDGSAHDLVTTWATTAGGPHHVIAAWFSGVETASVAAAHRTVYFDGTASGDLNITVADSQSGDVVVYGVFNWGTNLTADQTSIVTANGLFAGSYDVLMQYTSASGGNTNMTVTGGQIGTAWAFALVPASGGAATVRNLMLMGVGQ